MQNRLVIALAGSTSSIGIGSRVDEIQESAQRRLPASLVVRQRAELLEGRVVVAARRVLELGDRHRIPVVVLALDAILVLAARIEPIDIDANRRTRSVPAQSLVGDQIHADAADARRRAGEMPIDERGAQSHRLPHLRAAVTLQRGDPHLRHDLEQAFAERLDVALLRSGAVRLVAGRLGASQRGDGLEREIRVHRARAVGDQQCEVRDLPRFAGLGDETHAPAQSLANEVMVYRRDGERRRDRRLDPR